MDAMQRERQYEIQSGVGEVGQLWGEGIVSFHGEEESGVGL